MSKTFLQRCSQCILQPQPTGQDYNREEKRENERKKKEKARKEGKEERKYINGEGLVWFICLMAYQLVMGYLRLKFEPFLNVRL